MKRLIASLLVLVFGATMVMAEVSAANSPQVLPSAFADVEGLPLDAQQADTVEGKGVIGAVVGAFSGAVSGAITESCRTAYRMVTKQETRSGKQLANDIVEAAKWGAITMAVWGAVTGL
ncbi:hypothetical protein [Gracilinema caldarium]|uniref:Uncharacterized protein n=1 Tax=Gracilinema caldarium (strain ATCC 51460 / DSM 7334 / H1) TaxID=744872 RepID=F8EYK0_GRAC1|nr:hypothetical protein [Gracilinema caldarium]AEJ18432.1 hypothetical protein Spica_0265 [Gracilinema caldarium DSM 7334]